MGPQTDYVFSVFGTRKLAFTDIRNTEPETLNRESSLKLEIKRGNSEDCIA